MIENHLRWRCIIDRTSIALILVAALSSGAIAGQPPYRARQIEGVDKIRLLPPGEGNPRNAEGDFIELKDGRIMFVYSYFTGGGSDHAAGHLAARFSRDGGKNWTDKDIVIVHPASARSAQLLYGNAVEHRSPG